MTTNVVDLRAAKLASDSRWSFPVKTPAGNDYAVIYVDDTDFDKIEADKQFGFIFSGPAPRIEAWKKWARDPGRSVRNNLGSSDSCASINKFAQSKGMVMYPSKGVAAAEAALTDPLVADALKKVASGQVAAQAPAGLDPVVWTDSDIDRLNKALEECFGEKK